MRVTDEQLARWIKPAFGNEAELAHDTEDAIRNAIKQHAVLKDMDLRIVPKGSVKNRTEVRDDSDIDVAIIQQNQIQPLYVEGMTMASAGLKPYTGISQQDFKAAVGEAMRKEFGSDKVDGSGNRVFRIRGSESVMNADVIPSVQFWHIGQNWVNKGMSMILDQPDGKWHFNFPDHHHQNGVAKNKITGKRYKRTVRVLKNIETQLRKDGDLIKEVPSFLIESIAYNIPDSIYQSTTSLRQQIIAVCEHAWQYVSVEQEPAERFRWHEVDGLKFLFGDHQKWTKTDAQSFIAAAYGMVVS